MSPFRDIASWHEAIQKSLSALEFSLRGLPSTEDEVREARMLTQRLDEVLFYGYEVTRPKLKSDINISLEDLGL
jgi:hypothetical protein